MPIIANGPVLRGEVREKNDANTLHTRCISTLRQHKHARKCGPVMTDAGHDAHSYSKLPYSHTTAVHTRRRADSIELSNRNAKRPGASPFIRTDQRHHFLDQTTPNSVNVDLPFPYSSGFIRKPRPQWPGEALTPLQKCLQMNEECGYQVINTQKELSQL